PSSTQASSAPPEPVLPLSSDQVAAHLGETVDWYHHLAAGVGQLQIADVDSVSREKLHQQSLTAVSLALDFGKACAALLNEQAREAAAATTPTSRAAAAGGEGKQAEATAVKSTGPAGSSAANAGSESSAGPAKSPPGSKAAAAD